MFLEILKIKSLLLNIKSEHCLPFQNISEHFITTNEQFESVYYVCEKCDSSYITLVLKALGYFYNVCLNNYSKQKSDKTGNTKKLQN